MMNILPVGDDALDLIVEVLRARPPSEPPAFDCDTLGHAIMQWLERNYADTLLVDALEDARRRFPPDEEFALLRQAHVRACKQRLH